MRGANGQLSCETETGCANQYAAGHWDCQSATAGAAQRSAADPASGGLLGVACCASKVLPVAQRRVELDLRKELPSRCGVERRLVDHLERVVRAACGLLHCPDCGKAALSQPGASDKVRLAVVEPWRADDARGAAARALRAACCSGAGQCSTGSSAGCRPKGARGERCGAGQVEARVTSVAARGQKLALGSLAPRRGGTEGARAGRQGARGGGAARGQDAPVRARGAVASRDLGSGQTHLLSRCAASAGRAAGVATPPSHMAAPPRPPDGRCAVSAAGRPGRHGQVRPSCRSSAVGQSCVPSGARTTSTVRRALHGMEELLKHPLKARLPHIQRVPRASFSHAPRPPQLYRDSLRLAAYLAAKQGVPASGIREQVRPSRRLAAVVPAALPSWLLASHRHRRSAPPFAPTPPRRTLARSSSSASGAARPCALRQPQRRTLTTDGTKRCRRKRSPQRCPRSA